MVEIRQGSCWRWFLAAWYLKEEGFLLFVGAKSMDLLQQWVVEVDRDWRDL